MTQQIDVLIPFGNQCLALSHGQFTEALRRGRDALGESMLTNANVQAPATDRVLDAPGMERETGIPATWFLEQARRGKIRHLRAGKYVRFRLSETLDALRSDARPTAAKTFPPEIRLASSKVR